MKVTLDYKTYLNLITTIGSMKGTIEGLLPACNLPPEVVEKLQGMLTKVEKDLDVLINPNLTP